MQGDTSMRPGSPTGLWRRRRLRRSVPCTRWRSACVRRETPSDQRGRDPRTRGQHAGMTHSTPPDTWNPPVSPSPWINVPNPIVSVERTDHGPRALSTSMSHPDRVALRDMHFPRRGQALLVRANFPTCANFQTLIIGLHGPQGRRSGMAGTSRPWNPLIPARIFVEFWMVRRL